jgi:steroid delta-isomerase-like uncharacterized protein
MADPDIQTIARRFFDTWNAHDADAHVKFLSSDYVAESDTFTEPVRGPEAARAVISNYFTAFPDLNVTVETMLASGDVVTVRWRASGTHRGPLLGVAPTQRQAQVRGCTVLEIRNGKVTRQWIYWDTGHLLRQLGALPERSRAAGR